MTYNINDDDGADALDLNQALDRWQFSVKSGCAVSINSGTLAQADTLTVTSGGVYFDGGTVSVSSQSVQIDAADTSNPRKDVLYIDSSGNAQVAKGSAEAATPSSATRFETYRPAPADLSAVDAVVLAEVWVPAGASSVTASDLRDRRTFADLSAREVTTDHVYTGAREETVVLHTSGGTVYAEGPNGELASGDASTPSAVQTVVQTAVNQGGLVISDGTDLVVDTPVVVDAVTLRRVSLKSAGTNQVVRFGEDSTGVELLNCTFAGTNTAEVTSSDTLQDPLVDTYSANNTGAFTDTHVRVVNCEFKDHAGVALDIDDAQYVEVAHNTVHNVYAGISFQTRYGTCLGNVVKGSADIGIDCGTQSTDAFRFTIVGNTVVDTESHAINVFGSPHDFVIADNVAVPDSAGAGGTSHAITATSNSGWSPYRGIISGNYTEAADVHGILVRSASADLPAGVSDSDIWVVNNQFIGHDSWGIAIEDATTCLVAGNLSRDNFNGIKVNGGTDITVWNNRTPGNSNGVSVSTGVTGVVVTDNDARDSTTPLDGGENAEYVWGNLPTTANALDSAPSHEVGKPALASPTWDPDGDSNGEWVMSDGTAWQEIVDLANYT